VIALQAKVALLREISPGFLRKFARLAQLRSRVVDGELRFAGKGCRAAEQVDEVRRAVDERKREKRISNPFEHALGPETLAVLEPRRPSDASEKRGSVRASEKVLAARLPGNPFRFKRLCEV
jgi:hypothetical protein